MDSIIVNAMRIAYKAHEGQYRRNNGEPYINHPKRVVALLGENLENVTQEMYAAAWLHDVLEDTEVSRDEILEATNQLTLDYVVYLSMERVSLTNKALNVDMYLEKLSKAPGCVQNIKLCDMLDNMVDLSETDDDTWAIKCILKREKAIRYLTEADSALFLKTANRIEALKEIFNLK